MKGVIGLSHDRSFIPPKIFFYDEKSDRYLSCHITIKIKNKLNYSFLWDEKNRPYLLKGLKNWITNNNLQPEFVSLFRKYTGDEISLLREFEYVSFDASLEEIAEIVSSDAHLRTKKILIGSNTTVTAEYFTKIETLFGPYTNILRFAIAENYLPITFDEFKRTISILENYARKISSLRLSPLETIFYVHDLVRFKQYRKSSSNQNFYSSSDLTSVLQNDHAICEGYANLNMAILNRCGIPTQKIILQSLKDPNRGHAIVVSYVEDAKYTTKGLFYTDSTQENRENPKYLQVYANVARNRSHYSQLFAPKYEDSTFGKIDATAIKTLERCWQKNRLADYPTVEIEQINLLSCLIDGIDIIPSDRTSMTQADFESIMARLQNYLDMMDGPLSTENFLRIIVAVRSIEYYENSTDYPLSRDEIYDIYCNSERYFTLSALDKIHLFFMKKTSEDELELSKFWKYEQFMIRSALDLQIERIRLLKTMKNISETKQLQMKRRQQDLP